MQVISASQPLWRRTIAVAPRVCSLRQLSVHESSQLPRRNRLVVKASSDDGAAAPDPGNQGPEEISLVRKVPGPGYTFVLAGFLKILTVAGLAQSAPQDAVRTAFGQLSPYLLVPGALLMCWVAKTVTDTGLQENNKFMAGLAAVLVFLYFFIYKLLFRYEPSAEVVRRPRPVMSGPMAEVRAQLGDRDRSGLILRDSRTYQPVRPSSPNDVDDLAYYEGRTDSQVREDEQRRVGAAGRGNAQDELDRRNPLRQAYRRQQAGSSWDDTVMGPR